jgi:hypothetical protein
MAYQHPHQATKSRGVSTTKGRQLGAVFASVSEMAGEIQFSSHMYGTRNEVRHCEAPQFDLGFRQAEG